MEAAGIVSKQLRMKIVLLRNYMDYLYGGNASAAAVIQVLEDNLAKGNDDQSLVDQKRGKKQQQEGDDEQPPALPARDTPHSKARPPQGSSAYVALWGFPGHHENELEVAMGETLYAKGSDNPDEDSPWMYLCNEKGYSGYVPREYLREKVLLRQESVRISGGGGGGGGGTIRGTMRGTVRSRQSNFFASYEQSCYEKEGSRQSILATPPEQVQGGRGDADKGSVEGDGDMDDENDEGDVDPLMPVTQREFIVQEMVEVGESNFDEPLSLFSFLVSILQADSCITLNTTIDFLFVCLSSPFPIILCRQSAVTIKASGSFSISTAPHWRSW